MLPTLCSILIFAAGFAKAAILFQGGTVISFNESIQDLQILRNASLLVDGNQISDLSENGVGMQESSLPSNTTIINATNQIISPGFIDTHHHLWQTAFRTLASNTTLGEYYFRYSQLSPAQQYFSPDDVYLGQLAGCLELMNEGTTTVLDHAHGAFSESAVDAAVNATFDSKLRVFFAQVVAEFANYSYDDTLKKLQSLAQDQRFRNSSGGLVKLGLAYDNWFYAPMLNSSIVWNLTRDNNLSVITTHYLGGPWGAANSPELLNNIGALNTSTPVIFAHSSFLTPTDAMLLRSMNQYISTTPESELHYGHEHPYSHLIQDQAALGIDTHFTFSGSMITQARMWLQELRSRSYLQTLNKWEIPYNNPMSVRQAFLLITRNGGLALRRDDIGVIREGAKADLVVFNIDKPNMWGWSYDPIAAVILHSNGASDVNHVMVNGEFVKRNGSLTLEDYHTVRSRFEASAARIQKIWTNLDWEQIANEAGYKLGGLYNNLSPYGETEVVDVVRGNGSGY